MVEGNDNEIVIDQVVYAFTSAEVAKAFETCLNTETVAICKESWKPTGIYPPAVLDERPIRS